MVKDLLRKSGRRWLDKKTKRKGFLTALTTAIKTDPTAPLRKHVNELKVHEKIVRTAIKQDLEVPVVKWLSSQDMDTATRVQILDLTNCISHSTNTLGKGMNPIILPPAMGK